MRKLSVSQFGRNGRVQARGSCLDATAFPVSGLKAFHLSQQDDLAEPSAGLAGGCLKLLNELRPGDKVRNHHVMAARQVGSGGGETRPGELALIGPLALASIGALRFDTAVLSCCGLENGRLTAHDLNDAAVKQAMAAAAARVILATDSAKFRQTAMAVVCEATSADMVVTDTEAPADAVDALRAAGLEVRCV